MYLGRIVEMGTRDDVFRRPSHPYTQALMAAVPIPDPVRERQRARLVLKGDLPSPSDPPSGCRFRTRCPKFANDLTDEERQRCIDDPPDLTERGTGHPAACHYAEAVAVL
jgi:oligopeptide/dipeptide ABC transporter ATP-binding protein